MQAVDRANRKVMTLISVCIAHIRFKHNGQAFLPVALDVTLLFLPVKLTTIWNVAPDDGDYASPLCVICH